MLQGYLAKLGLGNLVSTGMLSINVLFGNYIQVNALDFLPNLEAITGIPTGAPIPLHMSQPLYMPATLTWLIAATPDAAAANLSKALLFKGGASGLGSRKSFTADPCWCLLLMC